jgi:hypothetical protein
MAGGGIRTLCTTLAHRPLQGDVAQKYLFNIGLGADGVIQKLTEGVHAHLVDDAPSTALPYIGADRLVLRGLTESDASYRARLKRAIDDYQWAGNARAVLGQVLGYVLADTPAARTVSTLYTGSTSTSTQWDYYDAGADTTVAPRHFIAPTAEWDWDSAVPTGGAWGWWRWYLVIAAIAPNDWTGPADFVIGDANPKIGTSSTWSIGFNSPSTVFDSIRIIVSQWKSAVLHWIVISFDGAEFRPQAGVLPDGYYGHGWKVVSRQHVASRSANARYPIGE